MHTRAATGKPTRSVSWKLGWERRILLLCAAAGFPGTALALVLLWIFADASPAAAWQAAIVLTAAWIAVTLALRRHIVFPLQTASNLLAGMREGDFSVRGRELRPGDTLDELTREVNALAEMLHEQRLGALEATALLRKVMEEIDVAIFAFDEGGRLKLLNRAAERLLGMPAGRALEQSAAALGLAGYLENEMPRVTDVSFPGAAGRWEIRQSGFRQGGLPHRMLVFSDLTRTLREEELQAWQRIVRVIGHEINNSLTPIRSISDSLRSCIERPVRAPDWEEDLERGLAVISSRSESLGRFMAAYAHLARLPQPGLELVDIGELVRRAAELETRLHVAVEGPPLTVAADPDQIEQLLINLIRNAADASLENGGTVSVTWNDRSDHIEIRIDDEGPGLPPSANLFVPFFTTKPGGSGIGLVLSRQIAEAHGGSLRLENRPSGGCSAFVRLPARSGDFGIPAKV